MKLLLLDKDGTLVNPREEKFPTSPWDQIPITGVKEKIQHYIDEDWIPAIISNQAGIAGGYKTLEFAFLEFLYCMELFDIKESFFCPDFGNYCWRIWGKDDDEKIQYHQNDYISKYELGNISYRKPSPGMLLLAKAIFLPDSILYIGDRQEDYEAAKSAKIDFCWAFEFHKND